jgi:hypothetical protein
MSAIQTPRQRLAAALAAQQVVLPVAVVEPTPVPCLPAIPLQVNERPTGRAAHSPAGQQRVKDFDKLSGPAQELVRSGGVSMRTAHLSAQPATRAELERERACLLREAGVVDRRLQ